MSSNDSVLAAFVAGASQAMMTLFGVDYYAMLWAFVGTLLALTQAAPMTRPRAIVYVLLSTLIGAAFGSWAVAAIDVKARAHLLWLSVVGGFGSQIIIATALQAVLARVKTIGGAQDNEQPSQPHS